MLATTPGSDIWSNLPGGFKRASVTERLFQRKISKEGKSVKGMEDLKSKTASPLAIRGSGGRHALGFQTLSSHTSPNCGQSGFVVQTSSMIAHLKPPDGCNQLDAPSAEERYSAIEYKMDKIEQMVERILSGMLSGQQSC